MDAVIGNLRPCKGAGVARVVKARWLGRCAATPGPHHLMELKGLIYDEVRLRTRRIPSGSTVHIAAGYPPCLSHAAHRRSGCSTVANDAICWRARTGRVGTTGPPARRT